jgi:hypothetical protein
MTKLLEEAWAVISQLPEQQQDAIAQCGQGASHFCKYVCRGEAFRQ